MQRARFLMLGGLAALLLPACSTPAAPAAIGWAAAPGNGASVFAHAPKVLKDTPADGMAHTTVTVVVKQNSPASAFQLLSLPTTWTQAVLSLKDTSALTAPYYSAAIPFASFSGSPLTATVTLPPLRPDPSYAESIYLQNSAGTIPTTRLAGSSTLATGLNAGANNLSFTVNVNGNEATYDVQSGSSTNNNVVTGNDIVQGDTVSFDTGMTASQSGVSYLNVWLFGTSGGAGTCYTGTSSSTRVLLTQLTTAASWNSFVFNTASNGPTSASLVHAVTGYNQYIATTFKGPTSGTTTTSGQIDVEAMDANNTLVGKASFSINVFGTPTMTVQVQ